MEIAMNKLFNYRESLIGALKNGGLVILGSIILAFGVAVFIVPFDLVTGGISGLSIALAAAIPVEFLTVDVWVTVITWIVFFVGLIFLGKAFALKTLISTIVYPIALSSFMRMLTPDFLGGIFDLTKYTASEGGEANIAVALICGIFGGTLVGTGCAVTFRGGGSTGGLDVIALIAAKYIKSVKSSVLVFIFDAAVVITGLFVMKNIIMCLIGIASAFVVALVIDKVFLGESKAFIAHIVSDKYEEINDAIINRLERGSTIINATGGYSGSEKRMIMVSFTMSQYAAFLAIISSIDRNAFVTIHRAHEIEGEGWTKYDVKKKK